MQLESCWVEVPAEAVQRTSYVDLCNLQGCLDAYYRGLLDHIPDLTRLYLPLKDLIPGNSLASQLDSETVRRALAAIGEEQQAALALRFLENEATIAAMAGYFQRSGMDDFSIYFNSLYYQALFRLADELKRLL